MKTCLRAGFGPQVLSLRPPDGPLWALQRLSNLRQPQNQAGVSPRGVPAPSQLGVISINNIITHEGQNIGP